MNKAIKNNILSRAVNAVFLLVVFSFLSACGGGGGGAASPTVTISDVSVVEGNAGTVDLVFAVSLSAAAGSNTSVNYATSDGTASAGQDYTSQTGTVTFAQGATSGTFAISVTGDTDIEGDESFSVTLSGLTGITQNGSILVATGTITNDDNGGGFYHGTASISRPSSTTLSIDDPDMRAMVDANDFVIMSVADDLLYYGTFTGFNNGTYSASVRVYQGGAYLTTSTVAGTITAGSLITGSITGTGDYASGNFNLTYDTINNRAPVSHSTDVWNDVLATSPTMQQTFTSSSTLNILYAATGTDFPNCRSNNINFINVVSEQPGRISRYTSNALENCTVSSSNGRVMQGFFTTYDDIGTDDSMLVVTFDNDIEIMATITCETNCL